MAAIIALKQQVLRGPNYWSSVFCKLVQTRLHIDPHSTVTLQAHPTLYGLVNRHLPHADALLASAEPPQRLAVMAALVSIALQREALCPVAFWHVEVTASPDVCLLMVEYQNEAAGRLAVNFAIDALNAPLAVRLDDITQAVETLRRHLELDASAQREPQHHHAKHSTPIPIIAVTGSNGKTTTTRLIAHLLNDGKTTIGFTTSDGIYIGDQMVDQGDTTGPISAQTVLSHPHVDLAVLETARGGILRAGLGFNHCDIAVVTNIQEDHLGIDDIETIDQLARVKRVVVNALKPEGWAVLNADNPYTASFAEPDLHHVAWFSTNEANSLIDEARASGLPVAYRANDRLVVRTAVYHLELPLSEVPITFNGSLNFMVENALAALLAAALHGASVPQLKARVQTFYPSANQTPGRMNLYEVDGCRLLVDFAHNPDGFLGIRDFLATVDAPFKIGIIVGTGDRKDDDNRALGYIAAQMFDLTLIHQVKFLRGQTAEALVKLLAEGIAAHDPAAQWLRIPDDEDPLTFALQQAPPGSFITALTDVLPNLDRLNQPS